MIPASDEQQNATAIEAGGDTIAGTARAPLWQQRLREAVRDGNELYTRLGLASEAAGTAGFPVRVPISYLNRMHPGDPQDPLLAQVAPSAAESALQPGYGPDPVGDQAAMLRPGVLHKYHGRVLLVTTGACAVHCRYCFRREFPYADANPKAGEWAAALEYIAADDSIEEVILSGGDPLSLADPKLADLVARIERIDHVTTLRIHTRLPVVLPERVDPALCDWLGRTRLATVVVLHANHANEIDADVTAAARRLATTGATLLNQSVLLHGVNDTAVALADLSRRLFAAGVLPYYLHLLDPVQGAAHFAVSADAGRRLMATVAARLPGYLVPRFVVEEPGRPGKTALKCDWPDADPAIENTTLPGGGPTLL